MLPINKTTADYDYAKLNIPLFIRLLEYAKEDAKEDMDLHFVAEAVLQGSKNGVLSMNAYDAIIDYVETQRKKS